MAWWRLFVVLLTLGIGTTAAAEIWPLPWRVLDHAVDGFVFDIAQTPDGIVWIGTETGLRRFDGSRFVLVTHPQLAGPIEALAVDREGALWGARRDHRRFRLWAGQVTLDPPAVRGPQAFPGNRLFQDGTGTLWSLGHEGLRRRQNNQW